MEDKIVTIGLSPCWDRTIEIDGINWGQHKIISSQKISPAGKAFNINKVLAWLGVETTAAGPWGSEDYKQMRQAVAALRNLIKIKFTKVPGLTRQNITIVDTVNKRQIHLRSKSTLANTNSLKLLKKDLQKIITKNSFCIFAGAMPDNAISLIESAKKTGAAVVIDTSGLALKKIVAKGGLYLIKPNIEELGEIIGRKISNETSAIISASKKLLKKSEFILVSRAEKGAILVGKEFVLSARYIGKKYDVYNTVGCGDFLLAGFLSHFCPLIHNVKRSLEYGIKAATAKAFGLNEKLTWAQAAKKFKIAIRVRICPK
jgi:1-phosphofructokinase family hexose kinase